MVEKGNAYSKDGIFYIIDGPLDDSYLQMLNSELFVCKSFDEGVVVENANISHMFHRVFGF